MITEFISVTVSSCLSSENLCLCRFFVLLHLMFPFFMFTQFSNFLLIGDLNVNIIVQFFFVTSCIILYA